MLANPSNRRIAEAYLERSQISKMELFPRIVNGRKPLTLSAKKLYLNPFSTNFTKWSNTLKQFVGNLPKNCLSVFDHFVGWALKGLNV